MVLAENDCKSHRKTNLQTSTNQYNSLAGRLPVLILTFSKWLYFFLKRCNLPFLFLLSLKKNLCQVTNKNTYELNQCSRLWPVAFKKIMWASKYQISQERCAIF